MFQNNLAKKIALFLATLPATSMAAYWSPHVGIDYKYWDATPAEQYQDLFPRIQHGGALYFGTRINGFFGIDVGYEQSERHQRTQIFHGGELVFVDPFIGTQVTTPEGTIYNIYPYEAPNNQAKVDLEMHSVFMYLNFYWEVYHRLELMFMMGAAFVDPKTHIYHYTQEDQTWVEYQNESEMFWSGRFGIGAQFNPIPCFGIRALLYWDQVNRLSYVGETSSFRLFDLNPYHSATSFNIGIVYSFSKPRRGIIAQEVEDPFY